MRYIKEQIEAGAYVLANTSRGVWGWGEDGTWILLPGEDAHVFPDLKDAILEMVSLREEHDNPTIEVFQLRAVDISTEEMNRLIAEAKKELEEDD